MGLRVLHVVEDFSRENTGVTSVVRQISRWSASRCEWVGVYATGAVDEPPPDGVELLFDENFRFPRSWRCPKNLEKRLTRLVQEQRVQVLHLHGLWRAAPMVAQRVARHLGIPSVLSVHGQLLDWPLYGQGRMKRWKKMLYWAALARPVFRHCTALHAITPLERERLIAFFWRNAVDVIPNAIDCERAGLHATGPIHHQRQILFLGRIHPIKGVDMLVRAFSKAGLADDWQLLIAGPEEVPAYARQIRQQIASSGLSSRIKFLGPVYGQEKMNLLAQSWVLVAPSHSEVVGMVNLEAAICSTPSITTYATGLWDWQEGGGVVIDPDPSALQQALEQACAWSPEDRRQRGLASRALVERRYSLSVVGQQWLNLYQRLAV